jgi:hypothetical protein
VVAKLGFIHSLVRDVAKSGSKAGKP